MMSSFPAGTAFLLVVTALALLPSPLRTTQTEDCPQLTIAREVEGQTISEMLRSGQPVLMESTLVNGDIDLSGTDVDVPFVLTNSIVKGRLVGSFTIFKGTLDFTDSCFLGSEGDTAAVDLHGAIFERDVTWPKTTFGERSQQKANFAGVRFQGAVDIRGAHFLGPADFRSVTFAGKALFQQALFDGETQFDGAAFQKEAVFLGTVFGARASFAESSASESADFAGASFFDSAIFYRISVDGLLSLRNVAFGKQVIFEDAFIGALEMRDNQYESGAELHMGGARTNSLEIDMEGVGRIHDDSEKCRILALVERTARANGNLTVANDASFRRQQIEDELRAPLWQVVNVIFRRWIAGYFVRPLHPFFSMVAFAILACLVRLGVGQFRQRLESIEAEKEEEEEKKTPEQWLAIVAAAVGASIGAVFSLRSSISVGEDRQHLRAWVAASGRWFEWFVQKGLTATFLIAVANASPRAKDIIDSVLRF
jgi:uncharacterized protein YjbI with pentapeptide repeats